jgi:hypothetical protein
MAAIQPGALEQQQRYVYRLQGTLLEACSCNVLCPCWIGEDPDGGSCEGLVAWHFDSGEVNGVDVSGLTLAGLAKIPGNPFAGNWKLLFFVDEHATDEQQQALLDAYTGKLDGPLADLAQLFGEILGIERAKISHEVREGTGELHIGDFVSASMEPYRGPDGSITTLRDSILSTIPGSPAYVAKAAYNRAELPKYDMNWSFEGRNAIQGDFTIAYSG